MKNMLRSLTATAALLSVTAGALPLPAFAQDTPPAAAATAAPAATPAAGEPVKVGYLTCDTSSGWGFIIGSSRSVKCDYSPTSGKTEKYTGSITKFGADIGYLSAAVMVWAVLAPSTTYESSTLAGTYVGVTGSAAVGVGVGAHVLVGGSDKQFTLQPISIEGQTGLNVAGGVAGLNLSIVK